MIRIANAPCSWGVIENVEGETGGYRRVVDEMAETGYAGTELGDWGFMPTDPDELRAELDGRGLALLGSWVNVWLHDPARHRQGEDDAVRTAKQLAARRRPRDRGRAGQRPVRRPGPRQDRRPRSPRRWASTTRRGRSSPMPPTTSPAGSATRPGSGPSSTSTSAPGSRPGAEVRRLFDMTDPDVLGLCLDTGHWTFGTGEDPVDAVREFGDRIWHVHFKDCDPAVMAESRGEGWHGLESVGHGVFCELGKGSVDFPGVLAALEEIGYDGWIVVEQDVLPGMGNPKESARRNREYLRSLGV